MLTLLVVYKTWGNQTWVLHFSRLSVLLMLKRKPAAGGYLESSDSPEEEPVQMPSDNPTKKPKTIPYAPPRLSTAFRLAPVPFQLSRSASAPARGLVTPTSSSAHLKPERSLQAASILQSWPVSGGNCEFKLDHVFRI
jgi:hypothetical protein